MTGDVGAVTAVIHRCNRGWQSGNPAPCADQASSMLLLPQHYLSTRLSVSPEMLRYERICVHVHIYIQNTYKYVLFGTYSVLYIYVRIIHTRYIHHYAYTTHLVHICTYLYIYVHNMYEYVLVGPNTLYSNGVSIWSVFVRNVRICQYLVRICT